MSLDRPKILPFSHQFLIQPVAGFYDPYSYYLNAVQQVVDGIIPESLWMELESGTDTDTLLFQLNALLPIFKHTEIADYSETLAITYLCPAEYTHHARRYVVDTLSKWLIPGKQIEILGGISLNFQFAQVPSQRYFVAQDIVSIRTKEENQAIRKNLPELIAQLKKKLPYEFLRQAENNLHPLFMPRNEEETIRNLIVLTAQIKYVRDLPQVSIHYEKQTEDELTFTVIIARLLKGSIDPLRKILEKSQLRMDIDDVRVMGYLKQRYAKEAAILRITVSKGPFFRADHSVDLLRARQKIVSNLVECLGEFRDFNGGMILKQDESLRQLRTELGKLSQEKEFTLENYFYSLKPGVMQTVHETFVLKRHFELLNTVLDADFKHQPYQIVTADAGKFFLCFVAATSGTYKENVLDAIAPLEISSRNLTMSFQHVGETSVMGFILRMETSENVQQFQTAIEGAFRAWSHRFYCIVR
jgi:hypothetical protein